jgi:hypothetical protein
LNVANIETFEFRASNSSLHCEMNTSSLQLLH